MRGRGEGKAEIPLLHKRQVKALASICPDVQTSGFAWPGSWGALACGLSVSCLVRPGYTPTDEMTSKGPVPLPQTPAHPALSVENDPFLANVHGKMGLFSSGKSIEETCWGFFLLFNCG